MLSKKEWVGLYGWLGKNSRVEFVERSAID